jgi:hypothetical protein
MVGLDISSEEFHSEVGTFILILRTLGTLLLLDNVKELHEEVEKTGIIAVI